MPLLRTLKEKALLRLFRNREFDNLYLRRYFAETYGIRIGLYSYGCFDRWRIPPGSTIGRYCSFAKTVRILDANHPIDAISTHPFLYDPAFGVVSEPKVRSTAIVVEDDVWIGHNAIITPNCARLGRGCIVGAGSIVTKDVPPYAIVAGSPARLLRYRFGEDVIAAVEASRWWELDKAGLKSLVASNPAFAFSP